MTVTKEMVEAARTRYASWAGFPEDHRFRAALEAAERVRQQQDAAPLASAKAAAAMLEKASYSYTGTDDGDFVIWKGETFVANVGGAALAEVGKQQIAFDVDKANAELIVNALNAYSSQASVKAAEVMRQEAAVLPAPTSGVTEVIEKLEKSND